MRIALEVMRLQADRLQDRQRLVAPLGGRADGVDRQRLHDLPADGDATVELFRTQLEAMQALSAFQQWTRDGLAETIIIEKFETV